MTSPVEKRPTDHEALADLLRDGAPHIDDLRRARLERRVIARSRGAGSHGAGSQGADSHGADAHGAGTSQEPLPVGGMAPVANVVPMRGRVSSSRGRMAMGALALAAAALIGFVVRGAMGPSSDGPRFAIGSAFETREGTLARGARFDLASGEEGRLEIGDVTAQLRDSGALEVRSIDPNDVRLVLDRGTAELAFHPHERGRQHLRIVTPSADVEVVGTIFTVHVDDAGTSVSVREGTVRVTARAGDVVLVHAGESVTVPRVTTAAVSPARGRADVVPGATVGAPVVAASAGAMPATELTPAGASLPAPLAFRGSSRAASSSGSNGPSGALQPPVTPDQPSSTATVAATVATPDAQATSSTAGSTASELASPIAPPAPATVEAHPTSELVAVHPRELALDSWAAHRPSSREIAAAWHDIDELQARGQFERSLALLVRLERYAPPSDQDEALFDRARTVQEALRRPRSARALYSEYVRRFPEGRHLQEVRRRLLALGAPAEGDPAPASAAEPTAEPPRQ